MGAELRGLPYALAALSWEGSWCGGISATSMPLAAGQFYVSDLCESVTVALHIASIHYTTWLHFNIVLIDPFVQVFQAELVIRFWNAEGDDCQPFMHKNESSHHTLCLCRVVRSGCCSLSCKWWMRLWWYCCLKIQQFPPPLLKAWL